MVRAVFGDPDEEPLSVYICIVAFGIEQVIAADNQVWDR